MQRINSAVEAHVVARRRTLSKNRLVDSKGVPEGFESLGQYVLFHQAERSKYVNVSEATSPPQLQSLPGVPESILEEENLAPLSSINDSTALIGTNGQGLGWDAEEQSSEDDNGESWWDTPGAAAQLHDAALSNDAKRIRHLIAGTRSLNRVPVDLLGEDGETAAVCAARAACAASCAALLDGRADPLARDNNERYFGDGVWPNEQRPDRVGKPGIDAPGSASEKGRSVVYHLRLNGLLDIVLSLVFPMTRVIIVRAIADAVQAWHGMSPMLVAARQGQADLMSLLLAHASAIPAIPGVQLVGHAAGHAGSQWIPSLEERADALLEAAMYRQWHCVKLLLVAGGVSRDISTRSDKMGRTVLHLAVCDGEAETVERLMEASASPHVRNKSGLQPLHEACSLGKASVIQVLLEHGADASAKVEDTRKRQRGKDEGKTPLQIAEMRGNGHLSKYFTGHS